MAVAKAIPVLGTEKAHSRPTARAVAWSGPRNNLRGRGDRLTVRDWLLGDWLLVATLVLSAQQVQQPNV